MQTRIFKRIQLLCILRYNSTSTYIPSNNVSTETSSNTTGLTKTSMVNPKTNPNSRESPEASGSEPYMVGTFKASLMDMPTIENLTEKESAHPSQQQLDKLTGSGPTAALFSTGLPPSELAEHHMDTSIVPTTSHQKTSYVDLQGNCVSPQTNDHLTNDIMKEEDSDTKVAKPSIEDPDTNKSKLAGTPNKSSTPKEDENKGNAATVSSKKDTSADAAVVHEPWVPTQDWVKSWKSKLPLQTIMRLLQVLVPQVEKICIDKGLTDESEILRFLQHGTLVGLLPVPHPILIRKYQPNPGTAMWFRTYLWGVIYLRNTDPPIWYDTDVKLFEIQRV